MLGSATTPRTPDQGSALSFWEEVRTETYRFRHQTFHEYLVAVELDRRLLHRNNVLRKETWELVLACSASER